MSTTDEYVEHCPALTRDGRPCSGKPIPSSGLCVAHDPRARTWRRAGGAARSNANRAAKLLPGRLRPVVDLLDRTLVSLEKGLIDPRRAVAIASVASALIRAVQAGELEERVRLLEKQATDAGRFKDRYGNVRGGPLLWDMPPTGA